MNAFTPPTNSSSKLDPTSNPRPHPEPDAPSGPESAPGLDATSYTVPRPDSESDPDLAHLRRTPNWWMATARINGVTPTLMERTPDELERRLRNPGRQIGEPIAT